MMPKLARPEFLRRLTLLFAAACALTTPARAAPAPLDTPDQIAAFAERVHAYSAASLVRWTIVGPTRKEAEEKIAAIVEALSPGDRGLESRLIAERADNARGVTAVITPQIGSMGGPGACSWQVWVSDPSLPAATGQEPMAPMASHDRMPVGPRATFRVGHFGLVQSRLYAFDETGPGSIRDLATVSQMDIPVPKNAHEDYIVLASARKTAPFLDAVKLALSAAQGERRELGPEFALRERLLGAGRGIGANIEAVPESMIARKSTITAAAKTTAPAPSTASAEPEDALMETCLYSLTPQR